MTDPVSSSNPLSSMFGASAASVKGGRRRRSSKQPIKSRKSRRGPISRKGGKSRRSHRSRKH